MNRTLDHLRHATRIVMARHRVIRWTPMPAVKPAFVPEWLRRGAVVKDFTGTTAL
jgi:hypothetical protein